MSKINIIYLNQKKDNTCGSCKHTNNNLGIVALHCNIKYNDKNFEESKVRSWNNCVYNPSRYEHK